MKKKFLEILNDTHNRIFPLNYKYVTVTDMPECVKNRKFVRIDLYNTNEYEPYFYYKPISKTF